MAKKKEEEVKKGLDEWMGTFSDMMTLLMCFFVMLFAMSSVDAAKFEAVANSFQSTFSIFKGGAQAIGDGILVSNGVSQLNQLDEYINSTGKTADSESDTVDFKEDKASAVSEKLHLSEQMAERMEEALQESMMQEIVDVEFTSDYVLLTLNGAFLFDSGRTDLKEEAIPVLNKIGVLLTRYADSDIEIEGHTDSVPLNGGKYENNDVLSSYRALAVFNYLKDNSAIDPSIMKHSGRGEYMPIVLRRKAGQSTDALKSRYLMRWELIKTRGKFKNETKLIIYHYFGTGGGQYCAVGNYNGMPSK